MKQDPTHPTGVLETSSHTQPETVAARDRKADAAVEMYVEKDKTLKQVAKKLGYPSEVAALAAIEKRMAEYLRYHPRSVSAMREMASRRLERLTRTTMRIADDDDHPEQLRAVAETRNSVETWIRLHGLNAPQQVIVSNPTDDAIAALAATIANRGAPAITSGDIFDDGADDSEVLELERRRHDQENDIVDAVIVENEDAVAEELDPVDAR